MDKLSFHPPGKQPKDESDCRFGRNALFSVLQSEPEIVMREPHPLDLVLLCEFKGGRKNHRMDMHVQMAVDVRKLESGGTKPVKLGGKFLLQLLSGWTGKIVLEAGQGWIVRKIASPIDQMGDFRRGQHGLALDGDEVNPYSQASVFRSQVHGMFEGFSRYHKTATGERPRLEGPDDGFIDLRGLTEVISVDNH
jgi:hypothetical protein